ncbi:unnamed protein product [Rotaria sordida]|uniref:Uncharacterized protein n=1 Tax=Rotaria sordida TaxID=392033 RepID=A0A815FIE9_9BILA|nr:unnamed protein product [Rotaria sordida]CAF1149834.1 unnamed protein product [Rotaria sordida]CAF1326534.1 unnamed protein product [Rotaria sordida]CAF1393103.1 unnamed protein product [Rotaria sordida]CAF1393598.1 unnamed protein product [Rotaria sordida]
MLNQQLNSNNITNQQQENSSNVNIFFDIIRRFNSFLDYSFSWPMRILQNVVDNIYSLAVNHTATFSCFTCMAITTTVSVTSIAVGVGVGTGIGCLPSDTISSNSTSS